MDAGRGDAGAAERDSLSVMLEELALRAWEIDVPWDGPGPGRGAAAGIDRLLVRVARGHGAVDIALGECLAAMDVGDRALRLGLAGLVDYAREALGMAGRTALGLARLARELAERPLLRAAVRRGHVSPRLAQELLPVAKGEAEAVWVARASKLTVREAAAAVRAGEAAGHGLPDEDWERIEFPAGETCRARVKQAFELAGELLGATAPDWQRLEAICQEYLGANPVPEGRGVIEEPAAGDDLEAALEAETRRWERLLWPEPVAAPVGEDGGGDVRAIDARVRELAAMRGRWDDLVGHLGLVMQAFRLWRHLGFASFRHYCRERLGMAERTVAQRVWLERRLHELPGLRAAMRQGRVTYEKARLVAQVAVPRDVEEWVDVAEKSTCIELRRKVEAGEKAQMCARERVSVLVPRRIVELFEDGCSAVMHREGRWIPRDECLAVMCDHFIDAWEGIRDRRRTPQREAIERDKGFCQVPGCSRAAVHAHHVVWRSRGGGDELENLVSLCAGHHLHGVHRGYLRVSGKAPDRLVWALAD